MAEINVDPVADARNEGWSFGGVLTTLWEVFADVFNLEYVRSPATKGRAAVTFPIDNETIPEGAVITSVAIKARVRREAGDNYSATFNLIAIDDTSKFTSRTLYPTTDWVDYEIGSYTRDPLGRPWDIETLNKLMAQVFTYATATNAIHVSRVWATVSYRVRPSVSISEPTGNLATASPTVTWTYSQSDGDVQASADWKIFTASAVSSQSFNPNKTTPAYSGSVRGDLTSFVLPDTLATNSYYIYVRVRSGVGAVSEWASKSFSVEAPHPGVPTVTATGNSSDSKATLTIQDTSNLLSAVQADAESGELDEYTATNCTFAKSSAQVYGTGTASYLMTSDSTSDMSITTDYFRIASDKDVTLRAQALADTGVGRTNSLTLSFFDSDYVSTGTPITGSSTDTDAGWTEIIVNGTTPSTAIHAQLTYTVEAPAGASEDHFVDHLGVMYGTDSSWTPGGHTSRNLFDSNVGGSPSDSTFSPAAGTTIDTITNESRTGASGKRAMSLTRVNPATSISFVGAGTAYNSNTSSNTSITLHKPAGAIAGDVLLAYITTDRLGSVVPPTDWDVIDVSQIHDSERDLSLHVLAKTVGGSDPASWTATMATGADRISAQVVAYRGAEAVSNNFLSTGTSTVKTNSATTIRTAILNNTTSNAWRVSAFASADDNTTTWSAALYGTGGTTATIQALGSGSSAWSNPAEGTSITIRRPGTMQSGDVMIAVVSWWETEISPNGAVITPPSGWNVQGVPMTSSSGYGGTGAFFGYTAITTVILWRKAGASEPSTWTATLNKARKTRQSGVVAYRGVNGTTPFITSGGTAYAKSEREPYTPIVNNTHAQARSISVFTVHGHEDVAASWTPLSGDTNRVFESWVVKTDDAINNGQSMVVYDSGGIINTGNRRSQARVPEDPDNRLVEGTNAWIGILNPATTPYVPGAAQQSRVDTGTGESLEFRNMSAFDSAGVIPAGDASVLGEYGGGGIWCMVSWHGILLPASPTTDGLIQVETQDYIDISQVSTDVLKSSGGKMTLGASFIGSAPGTPNMCLKFYRANRLLEAPIIPGTSFDDTRWVYTAGVFDIPEGATRVKASFSIDERENGDTVDMDRVMLSFGSTLNTWKNGTTLGLHPIWNVPQIEYRDDDGTGFGDWQTLGGMNFHPPVYDYLTGECTFDDHTIIPLTTREYRVRTYTHGLRGDGSAGDFGVASNTVNIAATYWWLKDLEFPENNMILPVRAEEITIATTNTATAYQPLGEDYPLIVTEGFKSDKIDLPLVAQNTDWVTFRKLARSGRSLFLQTDVNDGWWVRPISDIEHETLVSAQRTTDPYRVVKVSFLQVAPEV